MDPLSVARYGMMSAETRLSAAASAGWTGDNLDLAQESVDQIEAGRQFAASAKVASIADEMWRSLLDVQAG